MTRFPRLAGMFRPVPPRAGWIERAGWMLVLICVGLRATTSFDPFPYWGLDPVVESPPVTGLTPATGAITDCVMIVGSGVALLGAARAGRRTSRVGLGLWLAGTVPALAHAFVLPGDVLENSRLGLTWTAALTAALAASVVCRDQAHRRLTLAPLFGLIVLMSAKGVIQVFAEHPQTVATFQADREAFLAAQGWSPDSPSARVFERRLMQSEATGWFGMANVYASFAAAALVGWIGWLTAAWPTRQKSAWLAPALGAGSAAVALVLAGSKGGYIAATAGLSLLALRWLLDRSGRRSQADRQAAQAPAIAQDAPLPVCTARLGTLLALLLIVLALLAVIVRGLIGERWPERSLLFRWFYLIGAVRIIAHHPLLGTGPGEFKDAWLLLKPPESPEDVTSPHSVLLDYLACLGLGGAAWSALWLGWVAAAGRNWLLQVDHTRQPKPEPHPGGDDRPALPQARTLGWCAAGVVLVPFAIGTLLEQPLGTPEWAIGRALGLAGWLLVSLRMLSRWPSQPAQVRTQVSGADWPAAIAALTLALHAQIEMTFIWPGAAALACVLLAAGGADDHPSPGILRSRATPLQADTGSLLSSPIAPRIGCSLLLAPLMLAAWGVAWHLWRWERELHHAASVVRPLALAHRLARHAATTAPATPPQHSARELAELLAGYGIRPPAQTPAELEHAAKQLTALLAVRAIPHLTRAVERYPAHVPTTEALVRMLLLAASAEIGRNQRASAQQAVDDAVEHASRLVHVRDSASAWALLGQAHLARAHLLHDQAGLPRAATAFERAATLDPHGPWHAWHAAQALAAAGDHPAARRWAQETLRRDALQRLDPLRRLTPSQRRVLDELLTPDPARS